MGNGESAGRGLTCTVVWSLGSDLPDSTSQSHALLALVPLVLFLFGASVFSSEKWDVMMRPVPGLLDSEPCGVMAYTDCMTNAPVLFQVFSKVGTVKSCSISKKKNKAGKAHAEGLLPGAGGSSPVGFGAPSPFGPPCWTCSSF